MGIKVRKITIPITAIGKPRMTQRDRWKQRPCVVRYREYCDQLREAVGRVECTGVVNWTAYFPLPKSWSKRKKAELTGQPHQQKPDRDNIDKGILDALFAEDSGIHRGELIKLWDDGQGPRIELEIG